VNRIWQLAGLACHCLGKVSVANQFFMIIIGAGGHAKEIFNELHSLSLSSDVVFFDNTPGAALTVLGSPVLHTEAEVRAHFETDSRFIIGVGKPIHRRNLFEQFATWGGKATSVISTSAVLGKFEVQLADGLNIMQGALVTVSVQIGLGTLINAQASIHHDCKVGNFCELSPGCRLLGKVKVGNQVSIGAGAIVLPGVSIADNAVVGAGAVVTKNVEAGMLMIGIPARPAH
jgi:sugar O-acyltransferase (sialic acid O-acetyltransferase NeuD family)